MIGSVCLITLIVSPVSIDWSILRTVDMISIILKSAGILSPTDGKRKIKKGSGEGMEERRGVRAEKEVCTKVNNTIMKVNNTIISIGQTSTNVCVQAVKTKFTI